MQYTDGGRSMQYTDEIQSQVEERVESATAYIHDTSSRETLESHTPTAFIYPEGIDAINAINERSSVANFFGV